MKPAAMSAVSIYFLVLLILSVTGARGIRLLEEESMSALHGKFQEKSLAGGGGGSGVGRECGPPGRQCSSGTSSRKVVSTAKASAESKRNDEETGVDIPRGSQHHSKGDVGGSLEDLHVQTPPPSTSIPPQTYPDVMDIAGMDYSPAKRKPPIHN